MAGLRGKVALVTGSTSGIGLGIAHALAGAGADIVMNGFGDPGDIARLREDIASQHGVRVAYAPGDISDAEAVGHMVAQGVAELGSVDILVNNAGVQFVSSIAAFPVAQWQRVIAINLTGAFLAMQAAIPRHEGARLGADHQYRVGAWAGGECGEVGLCGGEAWAGWADQGWGDRAGE